MDQRSLISRMRSHRGPEFKTLDEYFAQAKLEVFNRMNDVARSSPADVNDEAVEWAVSRMDASPGSIFYLLLTLAAKDLGRRPAMIARYRTLMKVYPEPALKVAGHHLHEYHYLIDGEWLGAADKLFDQYPTGAWGIFEAAAMYEQVFMSPALVDAFEARRAAAPLSYFKSMLSLAPGRPEVLRRVLRAIPDHPAAAVEGAAAVARDQAEIQTPEFMAAMLRHFEAAPEKAWEFFNGACSTQPEIFDDALLDALTARTETGPGAIFTIVLHLIDVRKDGIPALMDRFVALVRRHPETGIKDTRYGFLRDKAKLIRADLVQAVCDGFAHNAYPAYEFLWQLLEDRPELLGPAEVDVALRNIGNATNRAFGFFSALIKHRPEFTREGALALFEALAQEPVHRAFNRNEWINGIVAISEAAHIKTGLEKALREPPRVGSRRARALMAIMFRQKLRARRHVLLEALRYAGGVVLWHKIPAGPDGKEDSEKYSPVWDFLMFIIDNSGEDAISTAAAERFLEGAFQLHYLCQTGAEHEEFLVKLDIANPPEHPFPPGMEFLRADADLSHLYRLVMALGKRFSTEPRITPLSEFPGRLPAAENERRVLEEQLARADGSRKQKLEERRRTLTRRVAFWKDPEYLRAFGDAEAERRLPEEARAFLRREKKDLVKQLRDTLRAEAIRIAVAAVETSRLDLYRHRLKDALGREVDLTEVEPKILPAFLWFQAVGGLRNNHKYLARLIEDRISKKPHDWLRTEPPAMEWAEAVRKRQPGIRLDRWRVPFSKEYQYRPNDALAEKRRRIKADLAQARMLLEKAGAKGIASETYDELDGAFRELLKPARSPKEGEKEKPPQPDPALLQEISMNLERVRISEATPDSDYEGRILLTVESDPFEVLFMGEYGFASCLSLRGSNAWSAVSNAIDIDKVILWAKEPGGNVVGRRLLALTPDGVLVYRTYTNRHGLALDRPFDEFVQEYAAHCGTRIIHGGHAGPLLSDRWYDDGAL
jgi:hypothetical protein